MRKVGDMVVTHVARIVMRDGRSQWGFCLTNSIEPPASVDDVQLHGPYPTEQAAQIAANKYVRERVLGPQCVVHEGGMWDDAWNKSQ
jgi:hypothetical protein